MASKPPNWRLVSWGVAWILGSLAITWHVAEPVISEFLLSWRAATIAGLVVTAAEQEHGGEAGGGWLNTVRYRFLLPDGRELFGERVEAGLLRADFDGLEWPFPVVVEYDPADPAMSRLQGRGINSFVGLFLRCTVAFPALLAIFVAPGGAMIRNGLGHSGTRRTRLKVANDRLPQLVIATITSVGVAVALADMPYGFYTLLRSSLCGFALFLLFGDDTPRDRWQRWLMGAVAVLYNPLFPVRIGEKEIWVILNVATAIWFWSVALAPRRRSNPEV